MSPLRHSQRAQLYGAGTGVTAGHGGDHALVQITVRVGEIFGPPARPGLELLRRQFQLVLKLRISQAREPRVRAAVRAEGHPLVGQPAQGVPVEQRKPGA